MKKGKVDLRKILEYFEYTLHEDSFVGEISANLFFFSTAKRFLKNSSYAKRAVILAF